MFCVATYVNENVMINSGETVVGVFAVICNNVVGNSWHYANSSVAKRKKGEIKRNG